MGDVTKGPELCAACGTELAAIAEGERRPACPSCGATDSRIFQVERNASLTLSAETSLKVVRAWDGNSLTLFGVIYAILVTVVGVLVARADVWWLVGYTLASISGFVLAFLVFPQRTIKLMRRLVDRSQA